MNNNLPKNWAETSLDNVSLKLQSGGTPSTKKVEYYSGGGIPFVKIEDITAGGKYLKTTSAKITEAGLENSAAWIVPCDTLLYSMYASYGLPIITKIPAATSQAIIACIPHGKAIELDYLYYYLLRLRPDLKRFKYTKGTTQENLSAGSVSRIGIPLAPLPEQKRIVAKIEELFTDLDAGVEALKKTKALIKKYRQSVLKSAFEGKLTEVWRNKNKTKLKRPELEQQHDTAFELNTTGLPQIPAEWTYIPTSRIIDVINNGYTPIAKYLSEKSGEIPFIKVYNLTFTGELNYSKNPTYIPKEIHAKDLKRSIVFPGDVLINIVGPPLGKVSVVSNEFPEWNINQAIVLFRPNQNILSKFIAYYLRSRNVINWLERTSKATAGQYNVKVTTCRQIPIPLMSVKEQKEIVSIIEDLFSIADAAEKTVDAGLKQAERLRQSILKKAFEGKLVPQDPKDEPAERLLARIKSEKAKAAESKTNISKKKVSK